MELDYKAIGKRLKIARINADMTQEQLCDKADLSPSHMSNIETGTTKVSLSTLVKLTNVLGITVDDLLCDNLSASTVQFEKDIAALLADCTPEELHIITPIISAAKAALRQTERLREN